MKQIRMYGRFGDLTFGSGVQVMTGNLLQFAAEILRFLNEALLSLQIMSTPRKPADFRPTLLPASEWISNTCGRGSGDLHLWLQALRPWVRCMV